MKKANPISERHLSQSSHDVLMNLYIKNKEADDKKSYTSIELEALQELYKFLPDSNDLSLHDDWRVRMLQRYHDMLYKEYCLVDLSQKTSTSQKVGMRWRTEVEVLSGKGQYICGNIHCQKSSINGQTWEVNFRYVEDEVQKNALVKIRLCEECSF